MVLTFLAQASSDETRLLILVVGLVIIAVMLSGLTFWYWKYTDPKRYVAQQPPGVNSVRNPVAKPKVRPDRNGGSLKRRASDDLGSPIDLDSPVHEPVSVERSQAARADRIRSGRL